MSLVGSYTDEISSSQSSVDLDTSKSEENNAQVRCSREDCYDYTWLYLVTYRRKPFYIFLNELK